MKCGRACVSDLALLRPLHDDLKESICALAGCIAGAVSVEDSLEMAKFVVGLVIEQVEKRSAFMEQTEQSDKTNILKRIPEGTELRDYVTSLDLVARKH